MIGRPLSWVVASYADVPFPHAVFSELFSSTVAEALLVWVGAETSWRLATTDFYEQFELAIEDVKTPEPPIELLKDPFFQQGLISKMENLFGCRLSARLGIVVHKLTSGQHIGIHNDIIDGGESYRLTVQLNTGLAEADGGIFILFNSDNPADIFKMFRPIHNTALAFKISERSHHAISTQHNGERYTIVFSFYADE